MAQTTFNKPIDPAAPVQCNKSILINADIYKVWDKLSNVNSWTRWNQDVKSALLQGDVAAGTMFIWKSGSLTIHSIFHTVDKPFKLGWSGNALGTFAIHNWTLSKVNDQTNVFVEESMSGFLAKVFKGSFNKSLETGMQNWLEQLKHECEK